MALRISMGTLRGLLHEERELLSPSAIGPRMTILGFALAVASFSTTFLMRDATPEAMLARLGVFVPLLLAFVMAFGAIFLYLISHRPDAKGTIDTMTFSFGEMLLYGTLSLIVSAGPQRVLVAGVEGLRRAAVGEPPVAGGPILPLEPGAVMPAAVDGLARLDSLVWGVAALSWALTTYVGPAVYVARIALPSRRKAVIAVFFLIALSLSNLVVAVASLAVPSPQFQGMSLGETFLRTFWIPQFWH